MHIYKCIRDLYNNVDFLLYMSHLKHVLQIEESICSNNNEKFKFDKFYIIYENL